MMHAETLTWIVAALATAGVIARPFGWPEATWAVAGASLLLILRLIAPADALHGILKGTDVYFFLVGMMILSELARREGLFDWLAVEATKLAKGSPTRFFTLIYVVGTVVTVFLSNDATAVVLTPAVCAAARSAKVQNAKPYLLICAFIANAASFVLPISNPANLVVFGGGHMPPLTEWLNLFFLPSAAAIVMTYIALFLTQRRALARDTLTSDVTPKTLSASAKLAAFGIAATAIILLICSMLDTDLGLPTFVAGVSTALLAFLIQRKSPLTLLQDVSWSVIPLVAGLFVIVEALEKWGLIARIASFLQNSVQQSPQTASTIAGVTTAILTNLLNNLPVGLVAGGALQQSHVPSVVSAAVLIGVDLGPNLSITGSLATILWLAALRREGLSIGFWEFLAVGTVVMFPALFASLGTLLLTAS